MKVVTLDKETFEKAFELCNASHSAVEIFRILDGQDDVEKQIAILQLDDVEDIEQAKKLILHLTNQDGPIREAVAIKLRELFIEKNNKIVNSIEFYKVFADAICDVNPNICRFVIEFLHKLNDKNYMAAVLIDKVKSVFERIESPDIEQKNFLTVRLFNIYWCFEALGTILPFCDDKKLSEMIFPYLERAIMFGDYTIDEKVAKIVTCGFDNETFQPIVNKLRTVHNFYVKRYFTKDKS